MPFLQNAPECADTDTLCVFVEQQTGNPWLAQASDWIIAKPLALLALLLLALVARWFAHRLIDRLADRAATGMPSPLLRRRPVPAETPGAGARSAVVAGRRVQRSETMGSLLKSIVSIAIFAIAVITALAELGLTVGPLIASAGIVGVALGFGAQSLVKDFLSGMFMLVEDQFGVGDIIDVGDASGTVEGVSLRTTRLRDVEGTVWHFPNGEIRRVGNKSQQWSRALIDFEVAYETDLAVAKETIKGVADHLWKDETWGATILEEPEVWGVEAFGPDGVAIRLVVKTTPSSQWKVMRELRQRMKEAFDAAGIEIPFPQRTVWVRPEGATLPGPEEANGHQTTEPAPTPQPG
jgi:small conductance mechanosensitive channel